jgi:poly-gamma-glutamate capsule biosynthesis protein CapA/YwtB (metallophosphatase superfamily)
MGGMHLPSMVCSFLLAFLVAMLAGCQSQRSVTLAFLGDINLGRSVTPAVDSFSLLAPELAGADLALANLESPLSSAPPPATSAYDLCAPVEYAHMLAAWELDLLSISNNHASDCGPDGPSQTHLALAAEGLATISRVPVYRTIHGIKLAFLAFDDVTSPLETQVAVQAIQAARAAKAQVIVSVHWGVEYQGGASSRQRSLAHSFADAGAILIWGHHPHVLQPIEWIKTPAGRTLVLYSLGNALFDQQGLEDTVRSALVQVTLNRDGVQTLQATPFIIDPNHSRLLAPDDAQAEKIHARLRIP